MQQVQQNSGSPEASAYAGYRNIAGIQEAMIPYFVFSLFPAEKEMEYRGVLTPADNDPAVLVSRCITYKIPNPKTRGRIAWLRVHSIVTHQRKLGEDLNDERTAIEWQKGQPEFLTVEARQLANAIKDSCFGSTMGYNGRVGSPGVFVISGVHVPKELWDGPPSSTFSLTTGPEAFDLSQYPVLKAEIAQWTAEQEALATWMISRCVALAQMPNRIHEISDADRELVLWGAGEREARRYTWFGKQSPNQTKSCIACGEKIPKAALVCTECKQNLVKFVRELMEMHVDVSGFDDPAVMTVALSQAKPVTSMNPASVREELARAGNALEGASEGVTESEDPSPRKPNFLSELRTKTGK